MTKVSRLCPQCKAVLKTRSDKTKFCSSHCRMTYYNKRRIFEGQNYVLVKKEEEGQGVDF
jgi:endogenous inhibitor of DNA gyrase (YacG/DUF329 family)